ncbi:sulfotransferase [Azospirillum sp.]|uniref:sulfotransferase n=1 Tax=Azospirillum sp. TaxID=34012 RepID=UPI002D762969|nr:sulfotransferase [Azospirillum sp.]HYD64547.1 sulfotransferase [Azospirillum sp.]
MHVFLPIYFNASLGGLHEHAMAQIKALRSRGHTCTVMCRPGAFAERARAAGGRVVTSHFRDPDEDVAKALRHPGIDLVHAHPFAARRVGLKVAQTLGVPFFLTIHGMYTDDLETYAPCVDMVCAVSDALRDHILAHTAMEPRRVVVLRNGVDTEVFRPDASPSRFPPPPRGLLDCVNRTLRAVPALLHRPGGGRAAAPPAAPGDGERTIVFASRFDKDKAFILDIIQETWRTMAETGRSDLHWVMAGDGVLRPDLEKAAAQLNARTGRPLVRFEGWRPAAELAHLFRQADIVVAPGRSALEAMACGVPVIAVGSKKYVGILQGDGLLQGMHTNFGGIGNKHKDYAPGAMLRDIDRIIGDGEFADRLRATYAGLIESTYRQATIDRLLDALYTMSLDEGACNGRLSRQRVRVDHPGLGFAAADGRLQWTAGTVPGYRASLAENGTARLVSTLAAKESAYLASAPGIHIRPPENPSLWPMKAGAVHALDLTVSVEDGAPRLWLWVLEYNDHKRVGRLRLKLQNGTNQIVFRAAADTVSFRLAIGLSDSGTAVLGPPRLFELDPERTEPFEGGPFDNRRDRTLPPPERYEGGNLVFIVGAPRSGTTWLLNLLAAHPDAVAATVDNLDIRINDKTTQETNIFTPNRALSDAEIAARFQRLSQANPGKVVVEKTPYHLLQVDRIRRVFPRAALVLVLRDGRDVATSMIHVGQNQDSWWKGAPKTIENAAEMWKTYAQAALRCQFLHAPRTVHYEELAENPVGVLTDLLAALNLSTAGVDRQIEACRDGKGIPIKGVFREGKVGAWRDFLTPQDVAAFEGVAGPLLRALGPAEAGTRET